jgi:outer membrane protein assembly factor BamB
MAGFARTQSTARLAWSLLYSRRGGTLPAFELVHCRTGPTLAADGTLYIGAADGMNAFNSDGSEKWWFRMKMINEAPTIGADGTIYAACGFFWVCAVKDSGSPLMQSSWPKWQHDPANSGNVSTIY